MTTRGRPALPVGARVAVRVPGSSANLGPGFDTLGLALGVWDDYEAEITDRDRLEITVDGQGSADLPRDERHLVVRSLRHTLDVLGCTQPAGLRLRARNGVPHGRGLGSSATAIVGGVLLAQRFRRFADPVVADDDAPLTCAVASRLEGHPDNASASVYGGFTISFPDPGTRLPGVTDPDLEAVRTVCPVLHPDLSAIVFVPDAELATATARAVLPASVLLTDAAANAGRSALLTHALTREPGLLPAATVDRLHQERRRSAYPQTMALVDRLRAAGHAAVVSGAGPSVLVLTTTPDAVPDAPHGPDGAGATRWRRLLPGIPASGARVVGESGPGVA